MNKSKITFEFILNDRLEIDETIDKMREILKTFSDYQHDNIWCYTENSNRDICVTSFPGDFRDLARSREVLKQLFNYVINETT